MQSWLTGLYFHELINIRPSRETGLRTRQIPGVLEEVHAQINPIFTGA